jgi:phosphate uptake regulator
MEYRKIIEFGKSSYVISLPKSWLSQKNLKKGDVVYLDSEGDNIVLYPGESKQEGDSRKVTINAAGMTPNEIKLHLISKYIRNFDEITIVSDDMKSKAKDIRTIVHDMMALEVVEEDASKMVTRAFLNMEDIAPLNMLRKMDTITREMLSDSSRSFEEDRQENIAERDFDVNRISYLIFRSVRYLQRNPAAAKKNSFSQHDLLGIWMAAFNIEKIADRAKRVAKIMKRAKMKKQDQKEFSSLYAAVARYYSDALDTFFARDVEKAFRLATYQKKLVKQCRDFDRQNWNYDYVPVLVENMNALISNSKAILTYVCDLG